MNTLNPTTGLAILTLTLMLAPAAYADHARQDAHRPKHIGHDGYARVVRVETVVRAPIRECRVEETRYPTRDYPRGDIVGPMIVGGIIGGALGHEIGHGRDAATLLGALIGSSIARDAARRGPSAHYTTIHEERCRVTQRARAEQHIVAYRVSHTRHGEPRSTRMSRDPGTRKYRSRD